MARYGDLDTQYFDDAGDPLINGKVFFYETGTTTPKPTFADAELTIANTHPVILTAAGRQPNVFFQGVAKAILATSADVQILVRDPVGDDSEGKNGFPAWVDDEIYALNEPVSASNNYIYTSLTFGNIANDPISSPANWQLLAKTIGFAGTVNGNVYIVDTSDPLGIGNVDRDSFSPIQFISSATASTTAVIDFTSLDLTLYNYRIVLENLVMSGASTALWFRTSTDNGSSFDSGVGDYGNGYLTGSTALGAAAGGVPNPEFVVSGTFVMDNSAGYGAVAEIFITKANASSRPMFKATFTAENTANQPFVAVTGGWRDSNNAINAVRLLPNTGTFSTGNVRLYRESKA